MENEQYFCKDCKHSTAPLMTKILMPFEFKKYLRCKKAFVPAKIIKDPVTGPVVEGSKLQFCSIFRMPAFFDEPQTCGPEARFWEPKNKNDLFKYMNKICHDAGAD
jgi:hypothetical protein